MKRKQRIVLMSSVAVLVMGCQSGYVQAQQPEQEKFAEQKMRMAAGDGQVWMVRELLDSGVDVNATGDEGDRALDNAVWNGHVDVVRLLLDRGADVNAVAPSGNTALIQAAEFDNIDLVRLLLERGADPRSASKYYDNLLDFAIKTENQEILQIVLDLYILPEAEKLSKQGMPRDLIMETLETRYGSSIRDPQVANAIRSIGDIVEEVGGLE